MLGQYCQESYGECITMGVCQILMIAEIFRILVVLLQFLLENKQDPRIKQKKCGYPRIWSFLGKSLFTVMLIGASAAQVAMWLLKDSTKQSIMLFSVFCLNLVCSLLWLIVLILERRNKGFTTKSTKASVSINFCLNAIIAILSGRNSLDSADNYGFYCYVGYLGITGVFQIILSVYQKDYDFVQINRQTNNTNDNPLNQEEVNLLTQQLNTQRNAFQRTNIDSIDNSPDNSELFASSKNKEGKEQQTPNEELQASSQAPVNSEQVISASKTETPGDPKKVDPISDIAWMLKVKSSPNSKEVDGEEGEEGEEEEESTQVKKSLNVKYKEVLREKIKNIRIERFSEMNKYSKKTVVFEIKYTWCGKSGSTKRSFREFGALNNDLKGKHKNMPDFPSKKDQTTTLTLADLEERKKQLCAYLQEVSNFCLPEELLWFLQSPEDFSGNNSRNASSMSKKLSSKAKNQTIKNSKTASEVIWEVVDELDFSEISH